MNRQFSVVAAGAASVLVVLASWAGISSIAAAGNTPAPAATAPAGDPNKAGYKQAQGVKMHKPTKQETDKSKPAHPEKLGGGNCTVGYGSGNGRGNQQCLPITPPSAAAMGMTVEQMPWACPEVQTLFPAGLSVNVKGVVPALVDPAHLDSNGDRTACGPGDS